MVVGNKNATKLRLERRIADSGLNSYVQDFELPLILAAAA